MSTLVTGDEPASDGGVGQVKNCTGSGGRLTSVGIDLELRRIDQAYSSIA
jgi:hypothetical protein